LATSFVGWDSKVIEALLRSSKSAQAYRNGVAERFINVWLFSRYGCEFFFHCKPVHFGLGSTFAHILVNPQCERYAIVDMCGY
jgi:hypothetical protein